MATIDCWELFSGKPEIRVANTSLARELYPNAKVDGDELIIEAKVGVYYNNYQDKYEEFRICESGATVGLGGGIFSTEDAYFHLKRNGEFMGWWKVPPGSYSTILSFYKDKYRVSMRDDYEGMVYYIKPGVENPNGIHIGYGVKSNG